MSAASAFSIKLVFISTHEFSSLYYSDSLPDPTLGGVTEWLHRAWLLPGAKPQHWARSSPYCIYVLCTALFLSWFFQLLSFAPTILDLNPVLHTSGLSLFHLVYRLNKLTLSCHLEM